MQIGSNPISPTNKITTKYTTMKRKRLKGAFVCSATDSRLTIRVCKTKRYFIMFWGGLYEIKFSEVKMYEARNIKVIVR